MSLTWHKAEGDPKVRFAHDGVQLFTVCHDEALPYWVLISLGERTRHASMESAMASAELEHQTRLELDMGAKSKMEART